MRKLTEFNFFKDTPLIDFMNTIHFETNQERDDFFLTGGHYEEVYFVSDRFNFIRDRQSIDVTLDFETVQGINYCTFKSDFEDRRYYAYVIEYEYINDNTTRINFLIDGIMTFTQGNVIHDFENLKVNRKHMGRLEKSNRIFELKNNDDVLETFTKRYTHEDSYTFDKFIMLIQSSADLTADFGDVDDPKVKTSSGLKFDKITAPVDLYVVAQSQFREFMGEMSPFPWISQNIKSVSLVPSVLLEGQTRKVDMESGDFTSLYELKDGGATNSSNFDHDLYKFSKDIDELGEIFGLDILEDEHLLRNEYTTSEVYTYDGQQLFIDNGQLSQKHGLFFRTAFISGFHNEVGVYIENYKAMDGVEGSFLNDAIYFRNFDDIPILIDNYQLSMSKSANKRQVAEDRLVTNRISNIADSGGDSKDRFYDATSLISNFNPLTLFGKFNDEHEFYKDQQAEFKDLALSTPTITEQSHDNSLAISQGYFGLHLKHAQPILAEWLKIKKYYKSFGYLVNDENTQVKINTMTISDYVRFTGNFIIKGADVSISEMMKAQFENGVRFWHNNNDPNPMAQDIMNNVIRH